MLTDTKDEIAVTQESNYHLPADVLENNNFMEDITHSSNTQETIVAHKINQDYETKMLESAKEKESSLTSR